ncbi:MAG: FtsX-like permease family protein, partial [Candidatus Gallimonas sp.]
KYGASYYGEYPNSPYIAMTVQCKDYNAATKVASLIDGVFNRLSGESSATGSYTSYNLATDAYQNFSMLNTVGGYLMLVMYTFGGIIFFATLLNLYNSVNYSVQARKNYIGMMRAIGAKKSMIPKLYFVEILLIFRKSLLWVLIFGGGISYGIKFAIDMLFKQDAAAILGATLSLNFAYFFVALALVFVIVFLIAFLFSRVACRAVTHKGILDVLSDDK